MERKRELNYMNAIACLFVILIHVLSLGISSAERTSWQAAVIYFPWRLSAFVVPMFLYTGAVKMARQFMDREVTMKEYVQYFLHRIQKIYVPYVLWTVLYYLSFMKINFVHGNLKEFLSYLLIGNLASPFYFHHYHAVLFSDALVDLDDKASFRIFGHWNQPADYGLHAAIFLYFVSFWAYICVY